MKKLLTLIFLCSLQLRALPQCTLVCNNLLEVALGENCEAEITFDMILEGEEDPRLCTPNDKSAFEITVMSGSRGPVIPTSPFVNSSYVGKKLYVKVMHKLSGNFCTGAIEIKDGQRPKLSCVQDTIVDCWAATDTSAIKKPVVEDCGKVTLSYTDVTENFGCDNPTKRITRIWSAKDVSGNVGTCTQVITVMRPNINQVIFPLSLNDTEAPALSCSKANTDPTVTGRPTFFGKTFAFQDGCNFNATYEDQRTQTCGASFRILRQWTVVDLCTYQVLKKNQVIVVKDIDKPLIKCPAAIVAGTGNSGNCTATVNFPAAVVSDSCGSAVSVSISTPFGTVNSNGGVLRNIPIGVYPISYTARDACGNTSQCQTTFSVTDNTIPTAVCDDELIVTLNNNQVAVVEATSFDEQSFDNCCVESVTAKRADQPNANYTASIRFDCNDMAKTIEVFMKVTDCYGNYNVCKTKATIIDILPPTIQCPPPVTILCTDNSLDLDLTGEPLAGDDCGILDLSYVDRFIPITCKTGTIRRTWTVTDMYGLKTSCVQNINVIDTVIVRVTFPQDYRTTNCISTSELHPDNLAGLYSYPSVTASPCKIIDVEWRDQEYRASGDMCAFILREWTVTDRCIFEPGTTIGVYRDTQRLEIRDITPPIITCPAQSDVIILPNGNGTYYVSLPTQIEVVDCLTEFDIFVDGDLGPGFFHAVVSPGLYTIRYAVRDGCLNTSVCSFTLTIGSDNEPPSITCLQGLSVNLPPDKTYTLDYRVLNLDTKDNFSQGSNLQFRLGLAPLPGQNPVPPAGQTLTFDCNGLGTNQVALWAGDEAGNWDYCLTYLQLSDSARLCEGPSALMAGTVMTETDGMVANVLVKVESEQHYEAMTDQQGKFAFHAMPMYQNYEIIPEKNDDHKNGVNTLDLIQIGRHILSVKPLDSPYKMIAADVNASGAITTADVIAIQKLILGVVDTFPNNKSWRFLPENFSFKDWNNPLSEVMEETMKIGNLHHEMHDANFIGIKIGDVDASADVSNFQATRGRSGSEFLLMTLKDKWLHQGRMDTVWFKVKDFEDIAGFQFSLGWDVAKVQLVKVVTGNLPGIGTGNFGTTGVGQGVLNVSWHHVPSVDLPDNTAVFGLVFHPYEDQPVKGMLDFSTRGLSNEAYRERESIEIMQVRIVYEEGKRQLLPTAIQRKTEAMKVFPNPFASSLQFSFTLQAGQVVNLQLLDITGRSIYQSKQEWPEGTHTLEVHLPHLPDGTMLFYQLELDEERYAGKVLKQK